MRDLIRRFVRWYKARFRLDLALVCELSKDMGDCDYHDFPDDVYGHPDHMVLLTCKRCGKRFRI